MAGKIINGRYGESVDVRMAGMGIEEFVISPVRRVPLNFFSGNFQFKNQNVEFVIKRGKIFGSLNVDGRIMLKPCPETETPNCHILLYKRKPT